MPTIIVALKDIVLDEANPIDLTALPTDEAIARLKCLYAFLAPDAEVTIYAGIATIHLPSLAPAQLARARQALAEGTRLARKGRYPEAIARLEEGLRLLSAAKHSKVAVSPNAFRPKSAGAVPEAG